MKTRTRRIVGQSGKEVMVEMVKGNKRYSIAMHVENENALDFDKKIKDAEEELKRTLSEKI